MTQLTTTWPPSRRKWPAGLGAAIFVAVFGAIVWVTDFEGAWHSSLELEAGGKIYLYRAGWFVREKCPLLKFQGHWRDASSEEDLLLPVESDPNDQGVCVRLETDQELYLVNKKELTKERIYLIQGDWYRDVDDGWAALYDDGFIEKP